MHPGLTTIAFRTPTLPPATHTNTWIVGEGELTVVDPASPYEDEQDRLLDTLLDHVRAGETVARLVLTHHHHDHVAGAMKLQEDLAEHGIDAPIQAHAETARLLEGKVVVDAIIDETEQAWGGRRVKPLHTPGHAGGHLVFHDLDDGWMIAGDMVAGIGTILLDPDEGDLEDYLQSLERMKARTPRVLLPSHGPDLTEPQALIGMYAAHRHMRTEQIGDALGTGGSQTALELVPRVYGADFDPRYHRIAARQITTHLLWLRRHGLAELRGEHWTRL